MRVCVLNEFFYPDNAGGTGAVLSELVATLRQNHPDVEIDVITSRFSYRVGKEELREYQEWEGIPIHRVKSPDARVKRARQRIWINLKFCISVLKKLLALNAVRKYDVVLVSTAPPTLVSAAFAFRLITRTPYVYILYDLDPDRAVVMKVLPRQGTMAKTLRIAQRIWLHQAGKVVVLGRCMKEYVAKQYGVPENQLELIPIGCDPEVIPLLPRKTTAFRKQHALEGFLICYSGNFGRYHDFSTILDTAKVLQKESRDIHFILVGGGSQHAHIEERVRREEIKNVRLFPFLPHSDYPDLLASADVSLVTLEPGMEGLCVPSKFYSILASGRPTLAVMPRACEVARVIQEEACGIRIDVHDVDSMVRAIRQLASDRVKTEQMGQHARQALEASFTTRLMAERYHSVLSQAVAVGDKLEGKSRPAPLK